MKQKAPYVLLLLTLAGALLDPNCATMTRETTQRIPVTSAPAGATVSVNGIKQGVTPLMITLARKWKGQIIRIESPGFNAVEIRPERKLSKGVLFGNLLLGVMPGLLPATIIGIGTEVRTNVEWILMWVLSAAACGWGFTAIDMGNGKGYDLRPTDLTVTLTRADERPRVDTMLVDVDDLQNIKWIRIREGRRI